MTKSKKSPVRVKRTLLADVAREMRQPRLTASVRESKQNQDFPLKKQPKAPK